jgi:hypothetical protein
VGTCIDDEMHALRRIGVSMDTAVWYEMARSIALDLTQGKKKTWEVLVGAVMGQPVISRGQGWWWLH